MYLSNSVISLLYTGLLVPGIPRIHRAALHTPQAHSYWAASAQSHSSLFFLKSAMLHINIFSKEFWIPILKEILQNSSIMWRVWSITAACHHQMLHPPTWHQGMVCVNSPWSTRGLLEKQCPEKGFSEVTATDKHGAKTCLRVICLQPTPGQRCPPGPAHTGEWRTKTPSYLIQAAIWVTWFFFPSVYYSLNVLSVGIRPIRTRKKSHPLLPSP